MKNKYVNGIFLALLVMGAGAIGKELRQGSLGFIAPQISGKSNVYDPQAGEIIYDSSDETFYGRTQSSTWTAFGGGGTGVPAGAILPYGGTSAPTGYLLADGSAVSRATYADLFAAVGTAFGSGDGSTTFNLPDLRGRFLRGLDGSANRDPDKASRSTMASGGNSGNNVGSVQSDAFQGHFHSLNNGTSVLRNTSGSYNITNSSIAAIEDITVGSPTSDGSNGTPRTTSETRPINAYVNYIIKI